VGNFENDFQDSYHDDPIEEISHSKLRSKFLTTGVLILGSIFFFQSTLASNISLNSGSGVEFGQGITQTVACSGSTDLILTPRSSFTNGSGSSGAHYFNSVTVSNIPTSCYGVDFTISAYNDTSSNPLAIFNSTSTNAIVYNDNGTFSPGIRSTGMTVASSTGTFTATFTVPVAQSSSVFKLTIQSTQHTIATCAQGGECSVGSIGPGGGTVFYVSSGFTEMGSACAASCRYLEWAPNTWYGGVKDPTLPWSSDTTHQAQLSPSASLNGLGNQAIGMGFSNTQEMLTSRGSYIADSSGAAYAVHRYAGSDGSAGQWFLPSLNELNEMYRSSIQSSGGFEYGAFYSSSERDSTHVWFQYFYDAGTQTWDFKYYTNAYSSRPIRAF